MTKGRRGFAFISVLLFIVVMFVMVTGFLASAHRRNFFGALEGKRTTARYAAEAGLSHCVKMLREDPDWNSGFTETPMAGGEAKYSVEFALDPETSAVDSHRSVNNLSGTDRVNGPRGENSVAPGTAEIVVTGDYRGITYRVAAVVGGVSGGGLEYAALADGRIRLKGDVLVEGVNSLADLQPEDGKIHSNAVGSDTITWEAESGEKASVSGTISTVSTASDAIDFSDPDGTAELNGAPATETGKGVQSAPYFNIPSLVANKSSASTFVPPGTGGVTLGSGAEEDFYYSGDLVINGDLVLEGATIYVDGDVTVNGSVSGDGGLYVVGDTELRGNSRLVASDDRRASIFSQGDIRLEGFDGRKYLESLAAVNSNADLYYREAEAALDEWHREVDTVGMAGLATSAGRSRRILLQQNLAYEYSTSFGTETAVLRKLANEVTASGSGPTQRFLSQKLNEVADIFTGGNIVSTDATVISQFDPKDPNTYAGIVDSILDQNATGRFDDLKAVVNLQTQFERLGDSYFQGVLYSNGIISATNQVTVIGAVASVDNGTQDPETIDGVDADPGDIIFSGGSKVTYVADFFEESSGGSLPGQITVISWIGR